MYTTLEVLIVLATILFIVVWAIWAGISWGDEDPKHLKLSEDWEPMGGRLYKGWLR